MKIVPTPARKRALRAEAHHLDPVVMIGNDGLTPAVLHEIDLNLLAHGLIKVRVFSDERTVREGFLQRIVDELDAAAIQHIGKLLVVYRPVPEAEQPDPAAPRPARKRPGIADPRTLRRSTGGSHRGNYMADSRRKKTIEAATGSSRRRPAEAGTASSRRAPAEAAAGSSRRRPAAAASESRRSAPSVASTADRRRKPAAPAAGSTRRRRTSQP